MKSTGPSAKQKNAGETDKDDSSSDDAMMILIQLLLQWKLKLNQKFLKTVKHLTKEYNKLIKYQKEKLRLCFKFPKFFSS